jgi:hypothetical protein
MARSWFGKWFGRWFGRWFGSLTGAASELPVEALDPFVPDLDPVVCHAPTFTEALDPFVPDLTEDIS